jgi:hypothetical protein
MFEYAAFVVYWGITILMLDDKCKFYQIYNVCSFPAPKQKEKNKHLKLYYFTRDFINQNLGIPPKIICKERQF